MKAGEKYFWDYEVAPVLVPIDRLPEPPCFGVVEPRAQRPTNPLWRADANVPVVQIECSLVWELGSWATVIPERDQLVERIATR